LSAIGLRAAICCGVEALFAISSLLLGEVAPGGMIDLAPWGTTAGATGILIWYTWYTTAKTIPSMNRAHSTEQREAREAYATQGNDLLGSPKT
jgi:hypothetical protein